MHPLGLCNSNDEEDLYEYGWVGVVKLEQPELDPSCLTVLGKVSAPLSPSSQIPWITAAPLRTYIAQRGFCFSSGAGNAEGWAAAEGSRE